MATIEEVEQVTQELVEAFALLLPELSPRSPVLTANDLEEILSHPSNTLLIARDETTREIVGAATVVAVLIPSGRRARLESVVVHPAARGRGVGEALCRCAVRVAREGGASALDLTSGPSREVANRLYERLGLERRDTNVYRMDLPPLDADALPHQGCYRAIGHGLQRRCIVVTLLGVKPLEFEWDPGKAAANKRKHKVSFEEARTAFLDEDGLLVPDPEHSRDEERFVLLGLSASLRILIVCHCYRRDDSVIRIISARKANGSERAQYESSRGR